MKEYTVSEVLGTPQFKHLEGIKCWEINVNYFNENGLLMNKSLSFIDEAIAKNIKEGYVLRIDDYEYMNVFQQNVNQEKELDLYEQESSSLLGKTLDVNFTYSHC